MPVLKRNDTVGKGLNLQRWRVVRKIGEGQFAEVFEVSGMAGYLHCMTEVSTRELWHQSVIPADLYSHAAA